jgi:predicted lipopolysaccharide heptosyltransferase III
LTILLIRLRLIGDVVFTTPVIGALRRRYPHARLIYLVEQSAAPVVSAHPGLSSVMTVRHSRGVQRIADDLRLARRLRRERVDLAIDLHGGPRSALLTWATRAPVRVGYDVPGRSWMYTHVVHRPKAYRPRHAVANQWDLLAAVDPALAAPPDRAHDRTSMTVPADVVAGTMRTLTERGVPAGARLVVLHVSAGNPFRRWPESSFATVAAALAAAPHHCTVLITAGPSDREAAARVIALARAGNAVDAARIVDAEHLSLWQLRATCDRAALFIGGDSGPMHVASTSDVPMVAIYGPTLPERSEPWRPPSIPTVNVDGGPLPCRPCDQRVCAPGDFRCLVNVPPSAVIDAAARLLEARR